MIAVDLPPLPAGAWLGVVVEQHEVAGVGMIAVTIRSRAGQPVRREWFSDPSAALAWAAGQSDARHLPLFDMRDPEA